MSALNTALWRTLTGGPFEMDKRTDRVRGEAPYWKLCARRCFERLGSKYGCSRTCVRFPEATQNGGRMKKTQRTPESSVKNLYDVVIASCDDGALEGRWGCQPRGVCIRMCGTKRACFALSREAREDAYYQIIRLFFARLGFEIGVIESLSSSRSSKPQVFKPSNPNGHS